ncbi:MAG: NAD-dependent epimerase/dehydratase family protein [Blastocatellia bacterium]|nr:NAD-dependent epimerase/dehydratase family protein [Blastocatellia bacterium]
MFTVFGSRGFIGSQMVQYLKDRQESVYCPERDELPTGRNLGRVIYCIGLTADFRTRPLDAVEAHVAKYLRILQTCTFDSMLYLSTTRLYGTTGAATDETATLQAQPANLSDLYNLSKAMGESLTLTACPNGKVARLSNIYGPDAESRNFLPSLIREALTQGLIRLGTSLDSAKDYLGVKAAVELLYRISSHGQERLYNVASGCNRTNDEIIQAIRQQTGCACEVLPGAARLVFPSIKVNRIRQEFGIPASDLLQDLPALIQFYQDAESQRD